MRIQINCSRLYLREINERDCDTMLQLHNNQVVQKYLGEEFPKDREFIMHIIKNIWQKEYEKYGFGRWAVIEKSSNKTIGWAGLKFIEEDQHVDIGYRFFPEFWGKGYATECSLALRDLAFNKFNLDEIWGLAWNANEASNNVLKKIGLKFRKRAPYDEINNDVNWYSLTKNEFKNLKEKHG